MKGNYVMPEICQTEGSEDRSMRKKISEMTPADKAEFLERTKEAVLMI